MSSIDEISKSLNKLKNHKEFYLLQCSSIYPVHLSNRASILLKFLEKI